MPKIAAPNKPGAKVSGKSKKGPLEKRKTKRTTKARVGMHGHEFEHDDADEKGLIGELWVCASVRHLWDI